mgnify:CR=1 FL=1
MVLPKKIKKNNSPWIYQLDKTRVSTKLLSDIETDVAIVGAGIAGVSTAFFTLKNTNKKVILLDGRKLAHGATGHNGGQIVSYFERPLDDIAEEFGLDMARDGQMAIESAWELMDEIYTTAGLDMSLSRFLGHAGIIELDDVLRYLKSNQTRLKMGLVPEDFLVADDASFLSDIPEEFNGLFRIVPHNFILERLDTKDNRFYASISFQKGCMNSALFCQEVVRYLEKTYQDRFSLFEHTHIGKIVLKDDHALLDAGDHTVTSTRVVLCTNGFENFTIINKSGLDIDANFHHSVSGLVGFMSGFLEDYDKPPSAIAYISKGYSPIDGEYYYVTRREFDSGKEKKNLISIGGPELKLEDRAIYASDIDYPEEAKDGIGRFVRKVLGRGENGGRTRYLFEWHGLMGYTKNLIRLIGLEPKNPVLLYNLGCNGVGLLPSIYGGKRISRILLGESLSPSIFDPKSE